MLSPTNKAGTIEMCLYMSDARTLDKLREEANILFTTLTGQAADRYIVGNIDPVGKIYAIDSAVVDLTDTLILSAIDTTLKRMGHA